MSGGLRLRDARATDAGEVRALTLAAYGEYQAVMEPQAWDELEEAVQTALDAVSDAEQIVAELDGRIVGAVRLYPAGSTDYEGATEAVPWPELRLLAVSAEARGTGVGQALVEECVRRARAAGASALGLHTSASMRAALRMYARMGFERDPAHDFQPPGAELIQAFRLPLTGDSAPAAAAG